MTTLPQTSTVRMPQGAGGPGAGPTTVTVPSAQGAPAFQLSGADMRRLVRANLWLIIILAVLGGVAGYFTHRLWAMYWPFYTATGLLEIRTEYVRDIVTERAKELLQDRLLAVAKTQAALLEDPGLFSRVLQKEGPMRETKWFNSFKDVTEAKEYLADHFRVVTQPDSELLAVRFTWSDPKDCKVIVEELVNDHLERLADRANERLSEDTKDFNQIQDQYARNIAFVTQTVQNRQAMLEERGVGTVSNFSIREAQLAELVKIELKARELANAARSQYELNKQMAQDGLPLAEVEQRLDMDPIVLSLARDLTSYEIQRDAMGSTRGTQHPDVIRATQLVETATQKLEAYKQEQRVKRSNELLGQLEGQTRQTQEDLEKIEKQVLTLKKEHVELSKEMALLLQEQEKLRGLNALQQEVANKANTVRVTRRADNQVQVSWASRPEIPDMPTWPKLWVLLPAGIVLGLGLALGIAFLREVLDDTVRSPRDLSRVGSVNLLGMICDGDDDPQATDARLPIFDAPHSVTAEQFRQVRTRLQSVAGLEATRSIMVTGPGPLGGKTTVAANLAAGLALNGRKTLLVDANFRRPEIHRLFGVPNEKGFSDVLNGAVNLDDALKGTRIPNLSVVTTGPKPPNTTELFESRLLTDFIERALEEFDHVIFDSAPFLMVSESVAMAPRVDGVITVVRAHSESRGLLHRMRDALKQVKAEHLGVVLNAVRAQGGGYYARNIKSYYTYNNGVA